MTEPNDDVLAARAVEGDRRAFAELLERHYGRIFRQGIRILGDADAAADLAQDVCVGLPRKLATYRAEGRFATWLHRVVVNAARDAMRRAATRRRIEGEFAEAEALERSAMPAARRESAWLRQALGGLSVELRATVVLARIAHRFTILGHTSDTLEGVPG